MSAIRAEPVACSPDVPGELAALCNEATRAEAHARTPDASAFSDALAAFAEHRASDHLAQDARARLAELRSLTPGTENRRARRLWTEASFGFRKALSCWPQTPGAREDLDEATGWMVRHELARGDLDAASARLETLAVPPADLLAERAQLREARARGA